MRTGTSFAVLVLIGLATGCSAAGAPDRSPDRATAPRAAPIFVSAGLAADAAIRACLGPPSGYGAIEEMEPHVASSPTDPRHLVAAWMARVEGRIGAILAAVSRDGGLTWGRPRALPFNACAGGADGLPNASDPWVAIGPEGRVYVSAIGWNPGESFDSASVVTVVTSRDAGETWGEGVAASASWSAEFMHDNTAVAADPETPGVAWVATTRWSADGRPAAVTRTTDGGRSWSPLSPVTPPYRLAPASAPQPVLAAGAAYVFYGHDPDGSRISFVRTDDDGATWSEPVLVHAGRPIEGAIRFPGTDTEIAVAEDIMHAAADPVSGALYVTFTTAAETDGTHPGVMVTASEDGGTTWSGPVAAGVSGGPTWRPTLAAAPGGPAIVTWFSAGAAPYETAVRRRPFAIIDGALEPGGTSTIDRFEWRPRYTGIRFLGDYHGLAATREASVAVFARSTAEGQRIVAVREAIR